VSDQNNIRNTSLGLSTTVNISFGMALVAGKKRVPKPATGKIAFVKGL